MEKSYHCRVTHFTRLQIHCIKKFVENFASQINNIALSIDTIGQRITDIPVDVRKQLEYDLNGKLFVTQFDEARRVTNILQISATNYFH